MLSLKLVGQYEPPRPRFSLVALNRKDESGDLMMNYLPSWDGEPIHHSNLRAGAVRGKMRRTVRHKHRLVIESLRTSKAKCACGRWCLNVSGAWTLAKVREAWQLGHIRLLAEKVRLKVERKAKAPRVSEKSLKKRKAQHAKRKRMLLDDYRRKTKARATWTPLKQLQHDAPRAIIYQGGLLGLGKRR